MLVRVGAKRGGSRYDDTLLHSAAAAIAHGRSDHRVRCMSDEFDVAGYDSSDVAGYDSSEGTNCRIRGVDGSSGPKRLVHTPDKHRNILAMMMPWRSSPHEAD